MEIKTEKDFSKYFRSILEQAGFDAIRIESRGTENGIPDLFIQGHGGDYWIELKVIRGCSFNDFIKGDTMIKIPWRPGQVRFVHDYIRAHFDKSTKTSKCPLLALGFVNCPEFLLYRSDGGMNEPFRIGDIVSYHVSITDPAKVNWVNVLDNLAFKYFGGI